MCVDPVTAITIASAATSVVGSVSGGMSANREAQYAAGIATNNATLARRSAADAEDRGVRDQMRRGQEVAQARSNQIAAAAANGLDTSFGSAADVAADTTVIGLADQQTIRENAGREATGFMISAQNFTEEAKAQRRQGKNALIKAGFESVGSILGAAGQIKGMKAPTSSTVSGYGRSGWQGSTAPNSSFKW